MKEIEKAYEAYKYEDEIYNKWETSGAFTPNTDKKKKPFTISMPPPNATGTLHLGHATMLAIQDIMIRYKRMRGFSTLWLPGTDHAGIATQNRVEKLLAEKGQTRHKLGREKFIQEVERFVEGSRNTIRNQIRKMGASCDWTRERYTLDEGLSRAVKNVFVKMYNDGLIYRGNRIVNWCPRCSSTLADDEVDYKEQEAKLYYIKYPVACEDDFITVATVRPETMLGDTAVAVNPDDKRYKKLIGKTVILPLQNRNIPIIADKHVDMNFGTGALKMTPAHSVIDAELAQKHKIQSIQVINENAKMTREAGVKYEGLSVKEARNKVLEDLNKLGLLVKEEAFTNNLSICYRCKTPIEPLISRQWFIAVDKPVIKEGSKKISLKQKALEVVKKGKIEIVPDRFNKIYFNWMNNLHDWCISRQIWWGHRLPVYYCDECGEVIVSAEPPKKCKCGEFRLRQDPDTLDTWFSSGLWTFSTLGWPDKTKDLDYFHPTSVMETGYDILFFWIARMIIMTTYALHEVPFEKVYLHGLIRTREGKKMSKSDPATCIDPLDMIEKYGTDALRLSFIIGATPGNDLRLYEEKIAGYRNFVNKIWNASRFTLMNVDEKHLKSGFKIQHIKTRADKWIITKLQLLIKDVTDDMENFRFSEAGTKIYNFTWSDYCDWYVELSKGEQLNPEVLIYILKTLLTLIHPFVPFVTEALWTHLEEKDMLIHRKWPEFDKNMIFTKEVKEMELLHQVIAYIRSVRAEYGVAPAKKVNAIIYAGNKTQFFEEKRDSIMKMGRLEKLEILEKGKKVPKAVSLFVSDLEIYLPLSDLIDLEKEKNRLTKEIKILEQEMMVLKNKLNNSNFVSKAPKEVVEKEKIRLEELKSSIVKINDKLNEF
ncbi:valine--tRNA ligase [Candidatus Peregrinibacteria bacterium]|nr:valine--tRNA ligase [Candidatus Peregrinibacteria bacterium]